MSDGVILMEAEYGNGYDEMTEEDLEKARFYLNMLIERESE